MDVAMMLTMTQVDNLIDTTVADVRLQFVSVSEFGVGLGLGVGVGWMQP